MWPMLKKPTNLVVLHRFYQDGWLKIQPEACQKLVDGYQKHLIEVKMAKGHLTEYQYYCTYIEPADFQRTHHNFIIEPNFMNVFCGKVVCVTLIPSQKNESCRNHWNSGLP